MMNQYDDVKVTDDYLIGQRKKIQNGFKNDSNFALLKGVINKLEIEIFKSHKSRKNERGFQE